MLNKYMKFISKYITQVIYLVWLLNLLGVKNKYIEFIKILNILNKYIKFISKYVKHVIYLLWLLNLLNKYVKLYF